MSGSAWQRLWVALREGCLALALNVDLSRASEYDSVGTGIVQIGKELRSRDRCRDSWEDAERAGIARRWNSLSEITD